MTCFYIRLLVQCSSLIFEDELSLWSRDSWSSRGKSSQASPLMKSGLTKSHNRNRIIKASESHALLLAPSHIWRAIMLSYQMASKMLGLLAGVAALITFVWFFPSMNALVCYQITDLSGRVVALVTFERFLAWMDSHVALQGFIIRRSEVTLIANKWLLSGVCPYVTPKVTSCCAGVMT